MATKRPLPKGIFSAQVTDLLHNGHGFARVEGKAVFLEGGLPEETVQYQYTRCRNQHDEGIVVQVDSASPYRTTPPCAHFEMCGGCSIQHLQPQQQIIYKQAQLLKQLKSLSLAIPEQILTPLSSVSQGYRHKARLGVKYVAKKERVLVGFREKNSPYLTDIQSCIILADPVNHLIVPLSELIGSLSVRACLPQIEVAVAENKTLLNLRIMQAITEDDASKLAQFAKQYHLTIALQPKAADSTYPLLAEDDLNLHYTLPAYDLTMHFQPHHFTQINPHINRQMIAQALQLLDLKSHETVLDLFCGLGNFTLPLARFAKQVIGVEGDQSLTDWATHNATANHISNAQFHCADLTQDQSQAIWRQHQFDAILIDPPRSGALEIMPLLGQLAAKRIVYVSCHPATLARDIAVLIRDYGYRLVSAGVMDMFTHTTHVESMVLLSR